MYVTMPNRIHLPTPQVLYSLDLAYTVVGLNLTELHLQQVVEVQVGGCGGWPG